MCGVAWFNIIVIVPLTKPGLATMKDKKAQKKLGFDPVFIPSRCGMKGAEIREGIAAKIIPEPPTVLETDVPFSKM
jgi:AGCS family alanine or glycine:cation symporter